MRKVCARFWLKMVCINVNYIPIILQEVWVNFQRNSLKRKVGGNFHHSQLLINVFNLLKTFLAKDTFKWMFIRRGVV